MPNQPTLHSPLLPEACRHFVLSPCRRAEHVLVLDPEPRKRHDLRRDGAHAGQLDADRRVDLRHAARRLQSSSSHLLAEEAHGCTNCRRLTLDRREAVALLAAT